MSADDATGGRGSGLNRRKFVKAATAAGITGLSGCAGAYAGMEDSSGAQGTPAGEDDYRCRSDVLTIDVYWHEALPLHYWEEDEEYIAGIVKDELEAAFQQYVEPDPSPFKKVDVNLSGTVPDKFNNSYALFEGPYLDRWIGDKEENSDEWQSHSNIVLRESTDLPSSLLGIAIMHDFTGELCSPDTQTCLVNYANLFGEYDQKWDERQDMLPITEDGKILPDYLTNALVTTPAHEVGHTLNNIHRDGFSYRIEAEDEEESDKWVSTMMGSFYSILFGTYGFPNTCQKPFAAPEYIADFMSTHWLDDLYLENAFSECAVTKFLETANADEPRDRDPLFDRGLPTGADALSIWGNDPDIKAEEERLGVTLDELWADVNGRPVSTVNIEDIAKFVEDQEGTTDKEEMSDKGLAVTHLFESLREEVEGKFGDYKGFESIHEYGAIA